MGTAKLVPDVQQTIIGGNVAQNDTHTILTFTKLLSEFEEPSIDLEGLNWFLVEAGGENCLGAPKYRGSVHTQASPCSSIISR